MMAILGLRFRSSVVRKIMTLDPTQSRHPVVDETELYDASVRLGASAFMPGATTFKTLQRYSNLVLQTWQARFGTFLFSVVKVLPTPIPS